MFTRLVDLRVSGYTGGAPHYRLTGCLNVRYEVGFVPEEHLSYVYQVKPLPFRDTESERELLQLWLLRRPPDTS